MPIRNVCPFTVCLAAMLALGVNATIVQNTIAQDTASETDPSARSEVELDTSEGKILIELNPEKAPKSVANFLEYVESGHFNGTVFHRVIPDFMIQGGGFDENLKKKETRPPILNEAGNGLTNKKYTVAMARTNDPDSATNQFFINTADNGFLNRSGANAGYAVFGRVVKGLDVVDKISATPTYPRPNPDFPAMLMQNVPKTPITIKSAKVRASSASDPQE